MLTRVSELGFLFAEPPLKGWYNGEIQGKGRVAGYDVLKPDKLGGTAATPLLDPFVCYVVTRDVDVRGRLTCSHEWSAMGCRDI